jgi:uncharacterized membrane protein (DUF485 family)
MENNQDKKSIYKEREAYRQRAFLMMLEIAVIIALPAFVALFLGKYLDGNNQNSNFFTPILLLVSFILSWVIIIRKYIVFSRKVKEIDRKIKEIKENVDNPTDSK